MIFVHGLWFRSVYFFFAPIACHASTSHGASATSCVKHWSICKIHPNPPTPKNVKKNLKHCKGPRKQPRYRSWWSRLASSTGLHFMQFIWHDKPCIWYIYWLWNVMNNWIEATSFSVGKHVAFELPALHSRAFSIGPWSVSSKVCYRGMGCVSTGCGILSFSDGPGEVLEFWFSEIWVDFQRISGVFIFHRIRPSSTLVLARWGGSLHQLRSASSSLTQTRATMSEQIHRHTLTNPTCQCCFLLNEDDHRVIFRK